MSNNITRIGIDLANNIFEVCAIYKHGQVVFNKLVKRHALTSIMVSISACISVTIS